MSYSLFHFTDVDTLDLSRVYDKFAYHSNKPNGLWVSNEADYGWAAWCRENEFTYARLKIRYEIILNQKHGLLIIDTPAKFLRFQKNHVKRRKVFQDEVKWEPSFEKYTGILIPHYFWQFRLAEGSGWYYSWDCASGCIWDLSALKEARLINTPISV